MFTKEELELMQFALVDNVINYIKMAHDCGVVRIMAIEDSLNTIKKHDKGNTLKKAEKILKPLSETQPPSEFFDDNESNILIFTEMNMVHKIDDLLDTEEYTFFGHLDEECVAELGLYEDKKYHKSFAEYYNYFIDLYLKSGDAE